MKQPCGKCSSTMFKSFQDDMIICVSCGTLKAMGSPPPMVASRTEFDTYKQPRRIPAEMIAVRVQINKHRPVMAEMIADRIGWKRIIESLEIKCHWKTARNIYLTEKGVQVPDYADLAAAKHRGMILANYDRIKAFGGGAMDTINEFDLKMSAPTYRLYLRQVESEMKAQEAA